MIRKFLFVFAAIMLSMAMASCSNNIDEPEEGAPAPPETSYIDRDLLGSWRCATDVFIKAGSDYLITVDSMEVVFEENGECYFQWQVCVSYQYDEPSFMTRQSKMYRYTVSEYLIKIYDDMGFYSEAGYHIDDDLVTFTPVGDTDIFPSGKEVSANLSKNAFEGLVYQLHGVERIPKKLLGSWKSSSVFGVTSGNTYAFSYSDMELVFMENGECLYKWNQNHSSWRTWYDEEGGMQYSESRNTTPHESDKYYFTTIDDIIKIHDDSGWCSEMEYTIKDDVLKLYKINGFATYPNCKSFSSSSEWQLSFLSYSKQ